MSRRRFSLYMFTHRDFDERAKRDVYSRCHRPSRAPASSPTTSSSLRLKAMHGQKKLCIIGTHTAVPIRFPSSVQGRDISSRRGPASAFSCAFACVRSPRHDLWERNHTGTCRKPNTRHASIGHHIVQNTAKFRKCNCIA